VKEKYIVDRARNSATAQVFIGDEEIQSIADQSFSSDRQKNINAVISRGDDVLPSMGEQGASAATLKSAGCRFEDNVGPGSVVSRKRHNWGQMISPCRRGEGHLSDPLFRKCSGSPRQRCVAINVPDMEEVVL
jgi:hypothetical protein